MNDSQRKSVSVPSPLGPVVDPASHADLPDPPELRLLAVDDRPEMIRSLVALLETQGYEIATAQNGAEAIDLLGRHAFDVVLLDLLMPGVSGHGVIEYAAEAGLDTKIIVVSGDPSFAGVKQALTRGAYDFIKKPYEAEELLATVERAANQLRLERENRMMHQRLRSSENLHRFIVNRSPDLVYLLDPRGCFTFVNERFETLLGYEPDELIGEHYSKVIDPADTENARYVFAERRSGERAARDVELRLRPKAAVDGSLSFEASSTSIELTAMGVYEDQQNRDAGRFVGTFGTARDITERKRAQEVINFQAYHDLLTHLPNRALFKDRLGLAITQARRNEQRLAVMFLDLDRFKLVNDTLGHSMGDRLLKAVAHRLKSCLRKGDTLSRFGGDEFTLLLPEVHSEADIHGIARKILEQINKPYYIDDHELNVGVSIGIAMFPEAGETVESLIQNADIAMYYVKGRGKNDFQLFTDKMNEQYATRLGLERELQKAVSAGEFEVHYQPQIDVSSDTVIGVEALVRWRHPRRGVILPGEFMSLAQESGLVGQIDEWVQRRALEDLRGWHDAGRTDLRLALNVSGQWLMQDDFVERFRENTRAAGVSPDCLRVEVSERVIMADPDIVVQKLRMVADDGVQIAVDGFGTGYSSLAYLQQLPVGLLKIDRSFVHEISTGTQSIVVDAIVAMAKGLDLQLIAEGVESRRQLDYLREHGCSLVQGFVHSQPMPAEEIAALLEAD